MSVVTVKKNSPDKPRNWEKVGDTYNTDEIIDAYLQGKEDGKGMHAKILQQTFANNVNTAAKVSEDLLKKANQKKLKLKAIHLKADSITNFVALFIVDEKSYISDQFRDAFVLAEELKKQTVNDSFYISFLFAPNSKNLNQDCIHADGFFLKYEKA